MLVGYIFAEAREANERSEQRHALQRAGCCDIVEESASADRGEQPELHRLVDRLGCGNVVVAPRLGSLGRSLEDVVRLMDRIEAAGLGFRSLEEGIDTTNAAGRAAAPTIANLAAFGRDVARGRIGVGVAAMPIRKRVGGRPSKLNPREKLDVAREVLSGRSTAADMARTHKVSEATISRLLAARRADPALHGAGQPEGEGAGQGGRVVGVLPFSALDGRLAIVGTSGSGKTYLITQLPQPSSGRYNDCVGWICAEDRDGPQRRAVPEGAERARL